MELKMKYKIGQIAKKLDIPYQSLLTARKNGDIPQEWLYSDEDIILIENWWKHRYDLKSKCKSMKQLCKEIGIVRPTLDGFRRTGNVPEPEYFIGTKSWYTPRQCRFIVNFFKKLHYARENYHLFKPGLTLVGASSGEISYANAYHLKPCPDYIVGKGLRSRYYSTETLAEFLKKVRKLKNGKIN
jgi:hypothetical protein